MLKRVCWSLMVTLFFVPQLYAQRPAGFGAKTVPHTVVYKLKPQSGETARAGRQTASSLPAALRQVGATQVQQKFPKAAPPQTANMRKAAPTVDLSLIYELKYRDSLSLEHVQQALMSTGMVEYVEPLYLREPLHQPNDPASDSTKTRQFYLKLVQAYEGWAVEKGDTNMVIGVLDTGFRLTHADLKAKVKYNFDDPVDGIDNDGDGYIDNFAGWDFADKDNNVNDDTPWTGHGTGVAGVAAGATNNGTGLASLGYHTKFLPLKVFSSVTNGPFGGYEAIVYAANKGCKVINLSWGGEGHSQYEQDIINYAVLEKDVLVVASGGNTNKLVDIYPASYHNVLSVGGTDAKDVKHKDHTYSYNIDLTAPSANIYTASGAGDNAYGGAYGTSFSSPIVAGSAALVRAKYPELSARQVAERIRVSADDIYSLPGNQPYHELLGKGRLNVKKALKQQNLRSVRCTSYALAPNTQAPAAGSTVALEAGFLNYLAPTSALQITLTSTSPYVTVERGTLSLGRVATLATSHTDQEPFILKIAQDAPENHKVMLRIGFEDDNYEDFQYVALVVNPSFVTLNANNLNVTLNNAGNIGYNGLNFKQGVGVKYKGGPSLLFEGGLIVATDAGVVSDNLHNEKWKNDNDFKPVGAAVLRHGTPLAAQEARMLMEATGDNKAGVRVKQVGSAWTESLDQNYVIVEYQLTNVTADTIRQLHAGLFADWDIGNYMENAAAWHAPLNLGYAYNINSVLPYAGIKLLTKNTPIYHAIDNVAGNDSTVSVDDGFSDAEKYKVVSGGVSRLKAGGNRGNNISHVVGATILNLAPGETATIAVAVLAADNLELLKEHAVAAQQKYETIKSGPAPTPFVQGICFGSPVMVKPDKGSIYNFYADSGKTELLGTSDAFPVSSLTENRTIYVSNADSLFESAPVPYSYQIPAGAVADFTLGREFAKVGSSIKLINGSKHAARAEWDFGDGTTSTEENPSHIYQSAGLYDITLTVTDSLGCSQSMVSKKLQVYHDQVSVYPNPASGYVALTLTGPIVLNDKTSSPHLTLTDLTGKSISPPTLASAGPDSNSFYFDVSKLAAGIYIAHFTYKNTSYVQRILVKSQ